LSKPALIASAPVGHELQQLGVPVRERSVRCADMQHADRLAIDDGGRQQRADANVQEDRLRTFV
jgi:hypothetical protein